MVFGNVSFRLKIFVVIFLSILIPTVTASYILYARSKQAITDQTSKVVTSSLNFAIQNIDYSLDSAIGMSQLILTDESLVSTAETKRKFPGEVKASKYSDIRELLKFISSRIKALNILDGIDSFYIYLPNQSDVIDSKTTFYEDIKEDNIDFLSKLKLKEYDQSWFVSQPVNFYTVNGIKSRLGSNEKLISYNKVLKDKAGNTAAVLAINVQESFLGSYYQKIQTGVPGDFIVMDGDTSMIAHPDSNLVGVISDKYKGLNQRITELKSGSGSFFTVIDHQELFVVYSISRYTDWRYVVIIPAANILGKVYEIKSFLLILICTAVPLVLGITYLLSYIFYKPLEKLVWAMQKIESRNLDVRIDDRRRDEYQHVYRGFNDMVGELKGLIRDLSNERVLKKEADIKLLQAQINPHFLYNTLESIHSIAKIKKVDEISQMVAALSKFFRISLSGGKDTVELREAVELAVSYLTIQNIRFKGRISYKIDLPAEILGIKVPKLILQPIVENSVYHGMERSKKEGRLLITGKAENGILYLNVEDNGIGIEEESLRLLKASIENDSFEDSKNFALKNINRQIRLKYGQVYGINIESEYGLGTRVTVRLPAETGDGSFSGRDGVLFVQNAGNR